MAQPQTIHYVPTGSEISTCGWSLRSFQYRSNELPCTDDVAKATCPRCIEGAAQEVEVALDPPLPGLDFEQATGRALDNLASNWGMTRSGPTPGYNAETDAQLRQRMKQLLGIR